MSGEWERVQETAARLRERAGEGFAPEVGMVLGSGLGPFGEELEEAISVDYRELPGFPVSTVPGHPGRFLLGRLHGRQVACLQGRVHYYEGYSIQDVVLPIRVLGALGVSTLILTNAAGGLREDLWDGGLMLLTDHIASWMPSPLRGPNEERFGTRFPDMSQVYSPRLGELAREVARGLGIDLKEGVYLQAPGPQYETPAEIRLYRALGADAVGMSTAVEAMAARHMGLEVCGISCITNPGAGLTDERLDHEAVRERARALGAEFSALLHGLVQAL